MSTQYVIKHTKQFKKDYKHAIKKGLNIQALHEVIALLQKGETLPLRYRNHHLVGEWKGFMECHITPDWLLIYCIDQDILVLTLVQLGTHSSLFG